MPRSTREARLEFRELRRDLETDGPLVLLAMLFLIAAALAPTEMNRDDL